MMERDFKKALEKFDHEAQNVPVGPSSARAWARLSRNEKAPVRWGIAVGWVAAVVLLVLGFAVWQANESKASSVAGFAVQLSQGTAIAEMDGTVVVSRGDCVLSDEDVVVNASADTKLRRSTDGIKLLTGKITVSARHRRKEERPLRFFVSGGTVEVVGTRFTLVDDGTRGKLTLPEGVVRFASQSTVTTELRAGETVDWPQVRRTETLPSEPESEPVPEPTPSPVFEKPTGTPDAEPEPKKKKRERVAKTAPAQAPDELDAVLERVAELRDRGEHEAAIAELRRALGTVREPKTHERLSFEIGSVLAHQVNDRARACEHWQKHTKVFGAGRYAQEIRLLSQHLRCELD
jgi:hypothetical protein